MGFTTPAFIRKNTPELRKKNEINKGNGYKVYVTYEEALEAGIQEALKLI